MRTGDGPIGHFRPGRRRRIHVSSSLSRSIKQQRTVSYTIDNRLVVSHIYIRIRCLTFVIGSIYLFVCSTGMIISSGVLLPPYVFNGFVAQLTFREMDAQPSQQPTPQQPHARAGSNLKNHFVPQQQPTISSIKKQTLCGSWSEKSFLFNCLFFFCLIKSEK